MVSTNVRIKIKNTDFDNIRKEIVKETGRIMRNNFGDLRPVIEDSIDDEISKNRNRFIPNQSEAAELGVGENGSISFEKTETAWEALQVKSGEGVTKFSARKFGGSSSLQIGNIEIDIDKESFFSAPRSIVATPDSTFISEIPWMRWFVEGATVGDIPRAARFSNRQPIPETSRTGRGIMIEGGTWDFRPRTTMLIEQLLDRIRIRVGRDLRINGATILRR